MRSGTKLRPDGYVIVTGPEGDIFEQDTLQCVHCMAHFPVPLTNTGAPTRGFCHICNGPICGKKCQVCVPKEQQLENMENKVAIDFVPIRVGF